MNAALLSLLAALATATATATAAAAAAAAEPREIDGWKLLWHDEFDGPALDATKWTPCERGPSDWNDTMSRDPRCFAFRNGCLHLRGLVNDDRARDPSEFLTGGVTSKGKFSFRHGKVVIRARFRSARGAWPALWMLGDKGRWPHNGEIDLMEHLNFDDIVYQTVHSHWANEVNKGGQPRKGSTAPIRRDEFNTYGVEWDAERLAFTVNGKRTFTYPRVPEKGPEQWPFDQPFYLILSMQIGGKWVGKTDPKDYPAGMEIDWVRVYRRDPPAPAGTP
jgi:beta-glucanase (GH16 family)